MNFKKEMNLSFSGEIWKEPFRPSLASLTNIPASKISWNQNIPIQDSMKIENIISSL